MNYARLIFDDTPALIPVPDHLQHRRVEVIFLLLDDDNVESSSSTNTTLENPRPCASSQAPGYELTETPKINEHKNPSK